MKNYLIIIKDSLPKSINIEKIVFRSDITVINAGIHTFHSDMADYKEIANRTNSLILVFDYLISTDELNHIRQDLNMINGFNNCHLLYAFEQTGFADNRTDEIASERDFFYFFSNAGITKAELLNFESFLLSAFSRIITECRINNYIVESFKYIADTEIVKEQKKNIEVLYENVKNMSRIDYLTNILNRRAIEEVLENESKRTSRGLWRINNIVSQENPEMLIKNAPNGNPAGKFLDHYGVFSILMIDIDFFKNINDLHGHLVGDNVLRVFGDILKNHRIFREVDSVGRYGGEEFLVLLPETNARNALVPAERLRRLIEAHDIRDSSGDKIRITISVGISEFYPSDKATKDIIDRADKALYYAKTTGRNKVVIFEDFIKKLVTDEAEENIDNMILKNKKTSQ